MAIRKEAKIKKYPRAPEFLEALRTLYNQYVTGRKNASSTCVLCTTAGRTSSHSITASGKCKECPWVQITKQTCQGRGFTNASRIAELPGWISMYELAVKQHYPEALKPLVKTIDAALKELQKQGYNVAQAVAELSTLKASKTKLDNAKYYVANAKGQLDNALGYLK